jgi:serine/threonine protein kinase/WD40 repeat protein
MYLFRGVKTMPQDDNAQFKGYGAVTLIGGGGFSEVYSATQSSIGREVVIKVIRPDRASQPDFIRRFETEAQIVARLEHPHITPLIDFWRDPQGAYLVMRYLRGGSIYDTIKQRGAVDPSTTSRMLEQIAAALDFAHRNAVIHRDIKPGNLLLDEDGNAYVADFGIAKDLTVVDPDSQTNPEHIIGSLDYIAPEQARGEPVTPRTDIYSLGVTLYEMLTGKHPFENENPIQRLYKHMTDPLPDLEGLPDDVQDVLNDIIQKATAKDPAKRYPDVIALAVAFREAVKARPVEGLTPREIDILLLLAERKSNQEIAQELFLSYETVRWHLGNIYKKLGAPNRSQAVKRARELGWLGGDEVAELPSLLTGEYSLVEADNPYKGLRSFNIEDARDFFGREKAVEKLLQHMIDGSRFERFLAIVGPSGSGKSSLVKAGLHPALLNGSLPGSDKWFYVSMKPQNHPLDELEIALTKLAANQGQNMRQHLERDERGLVRAAELLLPDDGSELFIVIDQFEEVFTLVENEQERQHFLNLLLSAASDVRSRVRLVVTLRADYYDKPLHYPEFGEMLRTRMETILPLTATGLEQAISRPAQRVGVNFEPGLVAQIVSEINYQAGALPLLQYALTELFEYRQGRLLTLEAYQRIGGVVGALAKGADTIYNGFDAAAQQLTKQIFLRLVTLGEGAEDTRRRTTLDELMSIASPPLYSSVRNEPALMERGSGGEVSDLLNDILESFTQSRLLTLGHDDSTRQPTVEVAHEAILREWATLREWLNDSRDDIRQERIIGQAADAWQTNQRDNSYLLSGTRLEQAEKWSQSTKLALTPLEREFVAVSMAARSNQQQIETERQAREKQLESRSRQFLHGLVVVFALATLISGGLMLFAINSERETQVALDDAEESATYASSIALAAAANSAQLLNNPDQAVAFAVAANTISANPPAYAESVLYDVAFSPAARHRVEMPTVSANLLPDGQRVAVLTETERSVTIIDIATGVTLTRWTSDRFEEKYLWCSTVSPDGTTIYIPTLEYDLNLGYVTAFDLQTGREIQHFVAPEGTLPECFMAFSPDGQQVTTSTVNFDNAGFPTFASLITWDMATGEIVRSFQPDTTGLENMTPKGYSLTVDGQKLLLGYNTGQAVIWDTNTGERIGIYGDERSPAIEVGQVTPLYTTEGIVIISNDYGTTFSATVTLWDEDSGELLHETSLSSVININASILNPTGTQLALGTMASQIPVIDLPTWNETVLYGHGGNSFPLLFLPEAQGLLSTGNDNTLRWWNLESGVELHRFEGQSTLVGAFVISPDGHTAVAQEYLEGSEAPLTLWDLETGAKLRILAHNELGFLTVDYSPDGRYVVSANNHGAFFLAPDCDKASAELRLIDTTTGGLVWEAQRNQGTFWGGVAFSSDGRTIVTGDWHCDNDVVIWDAATGEQLAVWQGHQSPVQSVSTSPDGKWVATMEENGTLILWDTATGTPAHTFPNLIQEGGNTIFSPDSQRLLIADSIASKLHLLDIATGQIIREFTGHNGFIRYIDFSSDNRHIVSSAGADGNIFVWDIETGEIVRRFHHSEIGPVGSMVAFSRDGQSLYYSDDKHVIHHVDLMLDEGELLQWVMDNRYVRDLTCEERQLYRVEPLCESE